jgi:hypothetical protein
MPGTFGREVSLSPEPYAGSPARRGKLPAGGGRSAKSSTSPTGGHEPNQVPAGANLNERRLRFLRPSSSNRDGRVSRIAQRQLPLTSVQEPGLPSSPLPSLALSWLTHPPSPLSPFGPFFQPPWSPVSLSWAPASVLTSLPRQIDHLDGGSPTHLTRHQRPRSTSRIVAVLTPLICSEPRRRPAPTAEKRLKVIRAPLF